MATTRKKMKKMTWMNSPAVMTFWPLFTDLTVLLAVIPAPVPQVRYAKRVLEYTSCSPNACVTKDKTSPATKILVSHLNLMREWCAPSQSMMIRPSSMYMVAANSAGATKMSMI